MRDPNQKITVDPKTGRVRVQTVPSGESKTQQQFAAECDINNIMKKYANTGVFTHVTGKQGRYGDFSMITDYQEMLDTVRYAQEAFNTLPADVRARFRNDPGVLLDFLQDSKNMDEAIKLGLVDKPKKVPADSAPKNDDLNDDKKGSVPPVTPSSVPPKGSAS